MQCVSRWVCTLVSLCVILTFVNIVVKEVDKLQGTHGLHCKFSQGRFHRHGALNNIIHRALTAAHVPSRLEQSTMQLECLDLMESVRGWSFYSSMGKWKALSVGRHHLPDTLAPSYLPLDTL